MESAKAIDLIGGTKTTTISNSQISFCRGVVCINLKFASNTLFYNVTVANRGIWGQNIWGTSFVNFNTSTSGTGVEPFNASNTVMKHSYLTITQGSLFSLFLNNSKNTIIEKVATNTPVSIQNCYNTSLDGIHVGNVTNLPAVLVYGSSNFTVRHTNFTGFHRTIVQ